MDAGEGREHDAVALRSLESATAGPAARIADEARGPADSFIIFRMDHWCPTALVIAWSLKIDRCYLQIRLVAPAGPVYIQLHRHPRIALFGSSSAEQGQG